MDEILTMLARLAVNHDRRIAELADRSTVVIILKDKPLKGAVLAERDRWQGGVPEDKGQPHPLGCSQRVLVMARLLAEMRERLDMEAGSPGRQAAEDAIGRMLKLQPVEMEACVFRLRPKFKTPHAEEGRPWVWTLVVGVAATAEFRSDIMKLAEFNTKYKGMNVAPQRTEDGFIVKELKTWLQGRGGGSSGDREGNEEEDDGDEGPGRKRGRGAGRG